jgi:threonine/homoserine/homoserine lactone efflux protein
MNISAFLSYVILATFTPGPNNIMAMSTAGKHGIEASFRFCAGVFFGFLAILGCAAAGTMLLAEFMPKVENALRWLGAGYILWLAWSIKGSKSDGDHSKRGAPSAAGNFLTGAALQFVNVKGILYALTAMSVFVLPHCQDAREAALFVFLLAFMCFVSTCCWALFGMIFQKFFRGRGPMLNNIMALLLAYCAASLFFSARFKHSP